MRTLIGIALCMLATASAGAETTGWRMVVYDGDVVTSTDTASYSEEICKARAYANNHAFKAGADAAYEQEKRKDPNAQRPPVRFSVRCERP